MCVTGLNVQLRAVLLSLCCAQCCALCCAQCCCTHLFAVAVPDCSHVCSGSAAALTARHQQAVTVGSCRMFELLYAVFDLCLGSTEH